MTTKAAAYELLLGGRSVSAGTSSNIRRLVVEKRFSETGHLEIEIQNGSQFNLTPADLKLGTKAELSLGYWGDLKSVFEGELVEFGPSADGRAIDTLNITAYDYSHLLKKEHEIRQRPDQSLYAVVDDIVRTAPKDQGSDVKLSVEIGDKIDKTKPKSDGGGTVDQVKMTDWEALDTIARKFNYKLIVDGTVVYIVPRQYFEGEQSEEEKFTFVRPSIEGELGGRTYPILSFDPTVGKGGQVTHVEVVSFEPFLPSGERYKSVPALLADDAKGYTDIKVRTEVTETIRVHALARTHEQAANLAESELLRRAERLVKGHVKAPLNPLIKPGQVQTILYRAFGDIGKQYSGEYKVVGVRHTFSGNQIYTEFDVERDRLTAI